MSLGDEQAKFTHDLGKFLAWAGSRPNRRVRIREAGRYPWVAQVMKFFGRGSTRSLHIEFLAADVVLDILVDGKWKYQAKSEAYAELGAYWKGLDLRNRWGGDWKSRKDGNHFSREYRGRQ